MRPSPYLNLRSGCLFLVLATLFIDVSIVAIILTLL